jgi:hypothetical protein
MRPAPVWFGHDVPQTAKPAGFLVKRNDAGVHCGTSDALVNQWLTTDATMDRGREA